MMMPNNCGDFGVILDLREDALSDDWVLLHLTSLFERQRTGLFEKPRRKTDLSDVMHETGEVS